MKASSVIVALLALFTSSVGAARLSDASQATAVGKVVKMLQGMLTKSQDDWKSDKEAYAKFKCYCDDNTDKKTVAIREAGTSIELLSNKIDELKGSSGSLAISTAQLKADMADNEQSRDNAQAIREKEETAFQGESSDLVAAIGQMDEAIKTLAAIGGDQTLGAGADNAKFMANYKDKALLSVKSSVKQALTAASFFLAPEQKTKAEAFLQAPFTGSYTSQSAQIVGILKDMKDTFKSNLQTAKANEKVSKESYIKFKANKESEHGSLKKSYEDKQASLGTNDGDLSAKKMQLAQYTKQKGEDEDFLSKLTVQCTDKGKEYQNREMFAANEEMALSKAIAILDNDVSAEKFRAVDATKGAFLQVPTEQSRRTEATAFLEKLALGQHSTKLDKVLVLLEAGNPFTVILAQVAKMVKLADDEQKVDDEQKAWCQKTNTKNSKTMDDTKDDLVNIESEIQKLHTDLDDPKSGIKKQTADAEESLKTNTKNQGEETKTRREENVAYQKDVHTMQDSISILSKAENVLTGYYNSLDNEQVGLVQKDPSPPKTFEGAYKGQNAQGKEVLSMLAFIQSETVKEETSAHDAELKSQHDYEDSMKSLVESERSLQETIAKLAEALANKEKELLAKHQDQTNTEQEKITLARYMDKIKPGCDFTLNNYDDRKKSRATEKSALQTAKVKLEGSPAFKAAQLRAKEDSFGKCKATCVKDEAAATCKACMAGTSVPGYCAGHKGAKGC